MSDIFLQIEIEQDINRDCHHYNWGGDCRNSNRPAYPREYGARCEFFDKFFSRKGEQYSKLDPNCSICKEKK